MSRSKIFLGICFSFAIGIYFESIFDVKEMWKFFGIGLGLVLFICGVVFKEKRWTKTAMYVAFFLFCIVLGIFRFEQKIQKNEFKSFFEQKVKWEGYIVEDPDLRTDKQLLTVRPKNFKQNLLITTTKAQDFFYGDLVVFEGKVKEPKDFDDFDYSGYLERFNVYGVVSYPKIIILKNSHGNKYKTFILKIKHSFVKRVSEFFTEPNRSLALGITIGAKRGLPADIVENFNITGTSHIVAMSGYNITIIIGFFGILSWVIGRRLNLWLSLFLVLGFVVVAGASASVVRAGVMGALLLFAFNLGRMYMAFPALIFTSALMLYANPRIGLWDIGFQLSFAATLGIVCLMPLLEKIFSNFGEYWGVKKIILGTFSAIFATMPIILFYFGRLSLVALLANILVLPFVPMAMLLSFLTIIPFLAPGFVFFTNLILGWIFYVTAKLSRVPFASVEIKIGKIGFVLISIFLLILYFILEKYLRKKNEVA